MAVHAKSLDPFHHANEYTKNKTERQRDRGAERQRGREAERQTERQRDRQRGRETDREAHTHTHTHTHTQANLAVCWFVGSSRKTGNSPTAVDSRKMATASTNYLQQEPLPLRAFVCLSFGLLSLFGGDSTDRHTHTHAQTSHTHRRRHSLNGAARAVPAGPTAAGGQWRQQRIEHSQTARTAPGPPAAEGSTGTVFI